MDRLGPGNKNFESCLNAHMVLTELSDNDQLFGKLAENVQRLITHACNIRNVNQSYALSALTAIFQEYPNYESHIGPVAAQQFQQTVLKAFFDTTYTCLLMLRSSDS